MSQVVRAYDRARGEDVALKILSTASPAISLGGEFRYIASLNHPGVVSVYDFDEAEGFHFIVMQYVKGQDLRQVLEKRGALGTRHALWIGARVGGCIVRGGLSIGGRPPWTGSGGRRVV